MPKKNKPTLDAKAWDRIWDAYGYRTDEILYAEWIGPSTRSEV